MKKLKSKIVNIPIVRKTLDFFGREKVKRALSVLGKIKNAVCWTLFAILVVMVVALMVTRINGNTPSLFGYSIYRVSSGSMEPELMVGDIILNRSVDDIYEVKVDDVVTYKGSGETAGMFVTHKVIVAPHTDDEGRIVLQTQGVANEVADREITADRVVGVLVSTVPALTWLFDLFLSVWGLVIFIALLLLIFVDELINLIKAIAGYTPKEEKEDISEIIERLQREELEKQRQAERCESVDEALEQSDDEDDEDDE